MKGCLGIELNLNMLERLLRVIVGGLLISSIFGKPFELTGWVLWLAELVGLGLVVTGIIGRCPIYAWMDSMTSKGNKKPSKKKPAKKARKTATKAGSRRTTAKRAKKAKTSKKKTSRRK